MPEEIKAKASNYAIAVAIAAMMSQFTLIFCQGSFAQVLSEFLTDMSMTKAESGVITANFGLVYALSAIVWGYVNDRLGSRITYAIMGFGGAAFMIIFANFSTDAITANVFYCLMGFFIGGMAAASLPKIIGSWFTPSKRGFGMSIASIGGVLCGMLNGVVIPQILIATGSWRTTLTIIGITAAVFALVYTLIFRDNPAKMGLLPMGPEEEVRVQVEAANAVAEKKKPGLEAYLKCLKLKNIWILGIFYIAFQFAYSGTNSYLRTAFTELGYDAITAGLSVTIYNFGQVIGQIILGNVSDHIPRKWAMAIGCWVWAIFGCVFFAFYGSPLMVLYVIIFCLGLGLGAMSVKQAIMTDYIPNDVRGTGSGVVTTMAIVGRYTGPMLTALLWQSLGIEYAFIVMGGAMAIAGAIVLALPKIDRLKSV